MFVHPKIWLLDRAPDDWKTWTCREAPATFTLDMVLTPPHPPTPWHNGSLWRADISLFSTAGTFIIHPGFCKTTKMTQGKNPLNPKLLLKKYRVVAVGGGNLEGQGCEQGSTDWCNNRNNSAQRFILHDATRMGRWRGPGSWIWGLEATEEQQQNQLVKQIMESSFFYSYIIRLIWGGNADFFSFTPVNNFWKCSWLHRMINTLYLYLVKWLKLVIFIPR